MSLWYLSLRKFLECYILPKLYSFQAPPSKSTSICQISDDNLYSVTMSLTESTFPPTPFLLSWEQKALGKFAVWNQDIAN